MTTGGDAAVDVSLELSLPEMLQMALPADADGRLWPGTVDLITATVIDLALLGRITATPSRWGSSWDAKLSVVDDTPLGNEPLDTFLQALAAKGKPRKIGSCIPAFGVSAATTRALVARGLVATHSTTGYRSVYLEPLNTAVRDRCIARLAEAASSGDVRTVALLDIRHWSENGWTPEGRGGYPPILADYPAPVALIAEGALHALFTATGTAM